MAVLNLPDTTKEGIGRYPYFPTRLQMFIWRNWEAVSPDKIAQDVYKRQGQVMAVFLSKTTVRQFDKPLRKTNGSMFLYCDI